MNRFVFAALSLASAAALTAALVLASSVYSRAKERQITYDYLDEALLAPERLSTMVDWVQTAKPLVRSVTPGDEANVGRALTEAWSAYAAAQHLGQTGFLADYYSGVALQRARQAARSAHETGTRMVVIKATAEPIFHHLDGSVLQLRSTLLTARFAEDGGGGLGQFRLTRDTTLTTLMNESSGWRIFSHERQDATEVSQESRARTDPVGRLAGINYYPAHTPWRAFWLEFDEDVIARDFARIRGLGANAIRVFLPRDVFLAPEGSTGAADLDDHLVNLQILLDLAEEFGLAVVPTLFDLRQGYDLAGWPDDLGYLGRVLPVLKGHVAVAFVDIKNEPDLDFAAHGRAQVEAWLRTMIALHRELAPGLALSVGWASQAEALTLADELDVLSYHDYAAPGGASARLQAVREGAGGKPVMITEIGESSFGAMAGWPGSPRKQAVRLDARFAALAGADGVFVWTLNDFPEPDRAAVGGSFWVRKLQARFGLFDPEGRPKPAADTVAEFFETFLKGARND